MLHRALSLLVAVCATALLHAQAVRHKHLLTSVGGGAGLLSLKLVPDSAAYSATAAESGALRFAFGYAIGDRWSLGLHYDRVGSDRIGVGADRVRATTYQLEGVYRPWVRTNAAVEMHMALGIGLFALTPVNERLPVRAKSGTITMGARYLHMLGEVLGTYVAFDHTAAGEATIDPQEGTTAEQGIEHAIVSWKSSRVTAGILVRF